MDKTNFFVGVVPA